MKQNCHARKNIFKKKVSLERLSKRVTPTWKNLSKPEGKLLYEEKKIVKNEESL